MTWFKVDDSLHSHVKAMRSGEAALGLWVLAGSWCAAHLTDGWIPAYAACRLTANAESLAAELVRAGFWVVDEREGESGWQFRSWEEYQPTRESVQQRRKADAERRTRWRHAKNSPGPQQESREESQQESRQESRRDTTRDSHGASRRESALPGPARPDPDTSTEVSPPCSPPAGDERAAQPARSTKSTTSSRFDEFWSIYPKRVGKQAAIKAWRKAVKLASPDTIIDGARRYAESRRGEDPQFTAHPSTWLNAGRWDDEPQPAAKPEMSTADQRIAQLQAMKRNQSPPRDPPADPPALCSVPSRRLA